MKLLILKNNIIQLNLNRKKITIYKYLDQKDPITISHVENLRQFEEIHKIK